ncbi:hypothetical protein F4782DRAFT_510657 [Xylaria castorea]|nr:hypothetical protein F4782DRAFT_510657 [Xylaria castorea]
MAPLLPTLAAHARSIFSSAATTHSQAVQTASDHLSQLGPLAARAILLARDDNDNNNKKDTDPQPDPSRGMTSPGDINNTFIFVLFGLIGVAFVLTGIWFFFWAKNGGFHFKQDDWEDYKSTVLRRRGPNGTLLSGATPSTNLGGGSVYKDIDDGATEYTGGLTQMTADTGDTASTLTGITAGASDIAGREKRRRAREKKEREREKKRDRKNRKSGGNSNRRKVGEDGVLVDEEAEADAKQNLRAYRAERPARVGGLNREADGSEWEGSTNPEMSTISGAEPLMHNRQGTPTSTPTKGKEGKEKEKRRSRATAATDHHNDETATEMATEMSYDTSTSQTQSQAPPPPKTTTTTKKAGGIRKVYSTADRTNTRENERLRAEARRLAEKGRAAGSSFLSSSTTSRRDFSYQRADLRGPGSAITEEQAGGETGSLMGGAAGRYLLPAPVEEREEMESSDIADNGGDGDLGTKSYRHYIPGISSASGSAVGSAVGGGSSVAGSDDHAEDRRERRRRRDAERAARATRRE